MCSPIVRATAITWRRSAEPSSSGGVPTAMIWNSPWATAAFASVEKLRRPFLRLRAISSLRPGSWIGMSPALMRAILASSTSTQTTSLPASARQAPVTRPT